MGKLLAAGLVLVFAVFVEQSFAQVVPTTPLPQNCTASGGVCVFPKKCNTVVLPGSFDCKGKRVCCKPRECESCIYKPNCKPIIARLPGGPYDCPKREVCCEDVEIPKCPGKCVASKKKCKKQGGTFQPRPNDCPPGDVCCV